ncbi:MAG: hypothetical protein ACRDJ3_02165 [Solirubrobacteraceae bacterium]
MVDIGVALTWVAISGVSLKWLAVLGRRSTSEIREPELYQREGELLPEELYPVELTPILLGGFR